MTEARWSGPVGDRATTWCVAVVYLAFALPSSMLGVMWPDVRVRFDQSLGALGLLTLLYGLGRLSMAVSGHRIVERLGMGRALVASLAGLAMACVCIAGARWWPMLLLSVGGLGIASGALDSIGSTFITRRANVSDAGLLHGFYGLGATIGPLVVATLPSWRVAVATGVVVATGAAAMIVSVRTSWPSPAAQATTDAQGPVQVPSAAIVASLLALGTLVAVEVTAGQWAFTYLTDGRNVADTLAAIGVAGYWGASTVGRLLLAHHRFASLTSRVGLPGLVTAGASMLICMAIGPIEATAVFLALAGLALSPIVPSLFATTERRVGTRLAHRAAGWQLLATNVGAIAVPALIGVLVDARGPAIIPVVAITVLIAVALPIVVVIERLPDNFPHRKVEHT